MYNLSFLYIVSFLSLTSALWQPRYDPCQMHNDNCTLEDFKVEENDTIAICRTTTKNYVGWNTKKSCNWVWIQDCKYANKIDETKKAYQFIDCTKVSDATADNPNPAPYVYQNPQMGTDFTTGTMVYDDPVKGIIAHADGPIEAECKKWKDTEYCVLNIVNLIIAIITILTFLFFIVYCVLGYGRKTDKQADKEDKRKIADNIKAMEEEKKEEDYLYKTYKKRKKRF